MELQFSYKGSDWNLLPFEGTIGAQNVNHINLMYP